MVKIRSLHHSCIEFLVSYPFFSPSTKVHLFSIIKIYLYRKKHVEYLGMGIKCKIVKPLNSPSMVKISSQPSFVYRVSGFRPFFVLINSFLSHNLSTRVHLFSVIKIY